MPARSADRTARLSRDASMARCAVVPPILADAAGCAGAGARGCRPSGRSLGSPACSGARIHGPGLSSTNDVMGGCGRASPACEPARRQAGRMRRPSELPEAIAGRPSFGSVEARRLGVTKARLAASDLTTLYRGSRLVRSDEPSLRDFASAHATRMPASSSSATRRPPSSTTFRCRSELETDRRLHVSVLADGRRATCPRSHRTRGGLRPHRDRRRRRSAHDGCRDHLVPVGVAARGRRPRRRGRLPDHRAGTGGRATARRDH